MKKNIVKKIRTQIFSHLYFHSNGDCRNTVFVAGTGRSGTTWISNILNHKNGYRYIFEPFYPQNVPMCRNFKYRQYLRPMDHRSDYLYPAECVVTGKFRNAWTDRYNVSFFSSKRLIKDIRANLLLKWLKNHFPEIKIVLVLRHPCAVACSKLKLGWGSHLELLLSQYQLMNDYLEPFRSEIVTAETSFEKHIFLWCIENYVPLQQFKRAEIHLVFYEHFCHNPEREIQRLFRFLGMPFKEEVLAHLHFPSVVSHKDSAIISGESLIDSWRKDITMEQVRRAEEILYLFGLDTIYTKVSMPNVDSQEGYHRADQPTCMPQDKSAENTDLLTEY
ncbi:sulfotransferase domain-containing protein [candidate division KSB1 bacterium]|nr:sulfotransferase domain-containing protein [candidate division KSB1 bacterium]NIR71070.1 sulfotransferase domain-containing protein [candidate division KSB1 bacterium]NIS24774.1 sulfotransferase domain-containing protein [candidate division KSB1 bacterium]NIT71679.1 sulfotransferase domain-containing protein [candidate division KSB1 bacterium]NIU25386.1 sulfotransferase domain-containing protein [candidate division KSB1 bacterium]